MARGINKIILVGNLGNDPEIVPLGDGGKLVNVSVATTDSWLDRASGQRKEQTEWHRVVFFGRLAETAATYLKKGSKIYLEGSIHYRKWTDKVSGLEKHSVEITAGMMQMLDRQGTSSTPTNIGKPTFIQAAGSDGDDIPF